MPHAVFISHTKHSINAMNSKLLVESQQRLCRNAFISIIWLRCITICRSYTRTGPTVIIGITFIIAITVTKILTEFQPVGKLQFTKAWDKYIQRLLDILLRMYSQIRISQTGREIFRKARVFIGIEYRTSRIKRNSCRNYTIRFTIGTCQTIIGSCKTDVST